MISTKKHLTAIIAKSLLIMALGLLTPLGSYAQSIAVKGIVLDDTDEPLIGATIAEKGNPKNGTVSDIDGNFTLNVPKGKKLTVSYIGYDPQEVDAAPEVRVVMRVNSAALSEVVVVGYGGSRARRDLTGSVGSISGAKLATVPVTSAAVALQGKVAGVQVTTVDGQPGADINIRIRGTASVSTNGDANPLFIVDGFQQDNINDIPPSDIQSIDILKDASLTAIYGAKGGNGVVVVTTKSAKEGRTTVSLNASLTWNHLSKKIDLLNTMDYVDYQYDRSVGTGARSANAKFFRANFGHPQDIALYALAPNHDWQDEVMGNTPMSYSTNVSIGGGTEKTRFNISLTQSEDKGIINKTGVRRTNINTKINAKLSNTLTFNFNPKFNYRRDQGEGGSHVGTGGIIDVLRYRPTNGLREFAFWDPATVDPDDEKAFEYSNPVGDIERNEYIRHQYEITNQASLEWRPISGLTLRTEGAYSLTFQDRNWFYAVGTSEAKGNNGLPVAKISKSQSDRYIWTNTASYELSLKDLNNFYFLLGQEVQHRQSNYSQLYNREFPHDITASKALSMMGMAGKQEATSSKDTPYRLASFFGQVNYNYDHRYLISFTARGDGTSFYSPKYQWGFFPSVSAGWVISEEKFLRDNAWLNMLKLRVAVGKAGKNLTKADMWSYNYGINSTGGPGFGENREYGDLYYSMNDYMPNKKIKWESTLTRNLAIDFTAFDNRLTITPEFYWNTTSDLLHESVILTETGYAKQWRNIGQITNKGIELTINGEILRGRDYNLSATLTMGANSMVVDKLNGYDNELWETKNSDYANYCLKVGKQMGLIYGFVYDGLYQMDEFDFDPLSNFTAVPKEGTVINNVCGASNSGDATMPGKIKLKDINGDGIIDENDRVEIGNTTPKLQGGFTLNGVWKNFDLTANFAYFLDYDVYNYTAYKLSSSSKGNDLGNVLSEFASDRWRYTRPFDPECYYKAYFLDDPVGALAETNPHFSRWNPGDLSKNITMDYFVEDASFLRCSDITVGYTLPEKITKKAAMSKVRVYASVSNPFVITKYSGFDPEVDIMSGLTPSWDYNRYPRSRGYVIGLNVTF